MILVILANENSGIPLLPRAILFTLVQLIAGIYKFTRPFVEFKDNLIE